MARAASSGVDVRRLARSRVRLREARIMAELFDFVGLDLRSQRAGRVPLAVPLAMAEFNETFEKYARNGTLPASPISSPSPPSSCRIKPLPPTARAHVTCPGHMRMRVG